MTLLLHNLPPITSSASSLHYTTRTTKSDITVCVVSSSNADKPKIKPKITKIKIKEPDDYHATLKALNSKGRIPRKSLGQHYMLNGEVNEQLVDAANVGDGDVVLEIGPGTGSLTNVLVESGANVLAIEKDPYMAALVNERFSATRRVKVIQEDFTRCHLRSHLSSFLGSDFSEGNSYAKVVANIPFNISTDIVKRLLPMGDIFSEVVLLLQVDAAVVVFRLKQAADYPQVSSTKSFFSMVNSAFNGKRKMLRKTLQHIKPSLEIEEALVNVGLAATSRPEELTLEDFVKLHNLIGDT
ncbi:putative 16S rRNA (adenine(1518)-N(6)/adenine(1519)-N(6))-dimethyltransferase [Helianthus annuus]|nr:putative 16S rRNA (adenine(1518)-N(6)/adenine(1519)-N(6))-dimethyltransferase [Helianthus annuus]KAJ0739835.1 putative 16S rRNA (adenine(1518)-N(6)/adenine(1519)-N(6))-dimethyltransferase [Helianthus annuus]